MKPLLYVTGLGVLLSTGSARAQAIWVQAGPPGSCISSIASGWGIGCGANLNPAGQAIFRFNRSANTWDQIAGAFATQITTDQTGAPWVTTANNFVYFWNGSAFQQFSNNQRQLVAVAVGDPTQPNEIYGIDRNGEIFVNHGTNSAPGGWGGGNNDAGWAPGNQITDPAAGIAVFSSTQTGCGTHEAFYVGQSTAVYRFSGASCAAGSGAWSPTTGFAGGTLVNSITTNQVIGGNGAIWSWNVGTSSFSQLLPAIPGGSAGIGASLGRNVNGLPFQIEFLQ